MYWARSQYEITSLLDLELLIKLFADVRGELELNKNLPAVEWTLNPFGRLLKVEGENKETLLKAMPFTIMARLCGPDTILAVSSKLIKLNPAEFSHPNKDALTIWADFIDSQIRTEIGRKSDLGYIFQNPAQELLSMDEFILACRLSTLATHMLFGTKDCALVFNSKCVYLPSISMHSKSKKISSCIFDKDDGFTPVFASENCQLDYINAKYQLWKQNGFKGELSHYCVEYTQHIL